MTNVPPTDPAVLQPGDTVFVAPKNPLASTSVWGLIVMLIAWMASRYIPAYFQDQAIKATMEVVGFGAGTLLALYGRWTANRPLGVKQVVASTVIK